ncbi:hypothetical protein [Demequina sp. NBRC 110055]|uniref:hypothetical protein n=1 Tax=Demequina sp. NBRC 110055 TaxID=1570344 RepID=UPI0009FDC44F|nr:hypothetical protein [Demequina sp. NBRC 110055]
MGAVLIVGAVVVVIALWSGGEESAAEPTDVLTAERLDWEEGRPSELRRIIDEEIAEGDCTALQEMFDVWERADDPNNNSGALMGYIDDGMRDAGCYGD